MYTDFAYDMVAPKTLEALIDMLAHKSPKL